MSGVEMLNEYKSEAGVGGQVSQNFGERLKTAGGCSDPNETKRTRDSHLLPNPRFYIASFNTNSAREPAAMPEFTFVIEQGLMGYSAPAGSLGNLRVEFKDPLGSVEATAIRSRLAALTCSKTGRFVATPYPFALLASRSRPPMPAVLIVAPRRLKSGFFPIDTH